MIQLLDREVPTGIGKLLLIVDPKIIIQSRALIESYIRYAGFMRSVGRDVGPDILVRSFSRSYNVASSFPRVGKIGVKVSFSSDLTKLFVRFFTSYESITVYEVTLGNCGGRVVICTPIIDPDQKTACPYLVYCDLQVKEAALRVLELHNNRAMRCLIYVE